MEKSGLPTDEPSAPTAQYPPTYNQSVYPDLSTQQNAGTIPMSQPLPTQAQPGAPIVLHMGAPPVGPKPTNCQCPACGSQIQTRVQYANTTKTHVVALLLCVFGCCLCSCLPYLMDSCRSAHHYCPSCNQFIGAYEN